MLTYTVFVNELISAFAIDLSNDKSVKITPAANWICHICNSNIYNIPINHHVLCTTYLICHCVAILDLHDHVSTTPIWLLVYVFVVRIPIYPYTTSLPRTPGYPEAMVCSYISLDTFGILHTYILAEWLVVRLLLVTTKRNHPCILSTNPDIKILSAPERTEQQRCGWILSDLFQTFTIPRLIWYQ